MSNLIKKYLISLEEQDESLETEELQTETDEITDSTELDSEEPTVEEEPMDGEYQETLNSDTIQGQDEEITAISTSMDNTIDATNSLEAYIDLLNKSGRDGISQETAAFMNVGLKIAGRHLPKVDLGLENYEVDAHSSTRIAVVSIEDLKDKLKAAKEYIIKLFNELILSIVSKAKNIASGLDKIESRMDKLDEAVKAKPSLLSQDKQDTNLKATPYMYAGGKPVELLGGIITEITMLLTVMVPSYVKDNITGIKEILGKLENDLDSVSECKEVFEKLMNDKQDTANKYSGFLNRVLPGNMEVKYDETTKTVMFVPSEGAEGMPTDAKYDVGHVKTRNSIRDLKDNISKIKGLHRTSSEIESMLDAMTKTAKKLLSSVKDEDVKFVSSIITVVKKSAMAVYGNINYISLLMDSELKILESITGTNKKK